VEGNGTLAIAGAVKVEVAIPGYAPSGPNSVGERESEIFVQCLYLHCVLAQRLYEGE
jgi:hypothetical protein